MTLRMACSGFSVASILFVAAEVYGQPRGGWTNLGSNGQAISAIAPSPISTRTIYVGTLVEGGVYRTDDGGVSWSSVATGLPQGFGGFINIGLAVDPTSPKIAYVGWSEESVPPSAFPRLFRLYLYKTLDGGSSWLLLRAGVGPPTIHPASPATLYIPTSTGILRSEDGGTSWRELGGPSSAVLALDPSNPSTIYAASWDSGAFKSVDGGSSWTAINTGLEQTEGTGISATSIAIDPNDSRILYIGAGPRPTSTTRRALCKSVDSGMTWRRVEALPAGDVLQLRAGGSSPTAVYCLEQTQDGNQLYRSIDQGIEWTNITSNLPSPIRIEVSPGEPAAIYAGTASAGLFKRTFPARAGSSPLAPPTVPFRR